MDGWMVVVMITMRIVIRGNNNNDNKWEQVSLRSRPDYVILIPPTRSGPNIRRGRDRDYKNDIPAETCEKT